MALRLEIGAGDRLLDLGSGRGWPGSLIADRTGAELISVDVPTEALLQGSRALRETLGGKIKEAKDGLMAKAPSVVETAAKRRRSDVPPKQELAGKGRTGAGSMDVDSGNLQPSAPAGPAATPSGAEARGGRR